LADGPHPVDLHVGHRVRARRLALGLTQGELGHDLGLSAQQVQKYENGANRVSASKLYEIARRLETTIDWFFNDMAGVTGPAPLLGSGPQAPFEAAPASHDATRALIAAYKALPDDAARAEVLADVQARAAAART
jgi:transcriptional regulator with XRE-family HTH domain